MATRTKHGAIGPPLTTTYTIHEAIDSIGFGRFQCKVIFLTCFCMTFEANSVAVLSLLGSTLQCQFNLTAIQQAAIPSLGMIGMAVANPAWGQMGDRYGRKWVLTLAALVMGYFGVITAFSPNLPWIYVNLFLVGVGFGGTLQSFTLCSEFIPTKHRTHAILFLVGIYGLAVVMMNVLAKLIIPVLGWRMMVLISTAPVWLFILLAYFLPESARFLLVSGNHYDAQKLLEVIAKNNRSPLPDGYLEKVDEMEPNLGKLSDIFSRKVLHISIPLIVTWFVTGICYFGISVMIPAVFLKSDGCHGWSSGAKDGQHTASCSVDCQGLSGGDFSSIILSSMGEFVALPCTFVIMTLLSRRRSLMLLLSVQAVTSFISIICMRRAELTGLMFVTRASAAALFTVMLIINVEIFPTTCRSVGVGVNGFFYKLGCLLSPLIGQVVTSYSVSIAFLTYGLFGVVGIVSVYFIPIETKNKELQDTSWER